MNSIEYEELVEQVLKASGAFGSVKKDLRRELESHIWEAICELEASGIDPLIIPSIIVQRFGSPQEIGKQFATMHNTIRFTGKIILTLAAGLIALFVLLPLEGSDAFYKYHDAIQERYIDVGWYDRTVALHSGLDVSECTNPGDGITNVGIPAGNVLTLCHTKWLVMKFLPPIQISGTRIDRSDVLHVMKMEGGLRSVDAVNTKDDIEASAQWVLKEFLHSLAVGAGNAPTVDMLNGNFDEPEEMGETIDRQEAFNNASSWWRGNFAVLADWNPDIDPNDEAALWQAACARQLICEDVRDMVVQSVTVGESTVTVVIDVTLQSDSATIAEKAFSFTVMRFEDGYPNDVTDDRTYVTDGFAY